MTLRLHRCRNVWIKLGGHPCWRVQHALDAAGVEYEIVRGPVRRSKRDALEQLSGQRLYPVIEYPDGRIYRAESKEMAERIRARVVPQPHPGHPLHDGAHPTHATDTESI